MGTMILRAFVLKLLICVLMIGTKMEGKDGLPSIAQSLKSNSSTQVDQNSPSSPKTPSLTPLRSKAKLEQNFSISSQTNKIQTQDRTLKSQYKITKEKIVSTDLFPQAPYFLVASFGEMFNLKIKSKQLETLFQSKGFPLTHTSTNEVEFIYQSPWNLAQIQEKIKKAFLSYYAHYNPKISQVRLKPIGQIPHQISSFSLRQIDEKNFKKNRFMVILETSSHSTSSLQPFLCEIEASLEVFTAQAEIRSGGDLENLKQERIAFSSLSSLPATKEEIFSSSAKSFISKGQIIFSSKLKPKILVKKGDLIDVSFKEGKISLEIRLEAVQSGSMGDEIWAKNMESKKQIKVKITGIRKGQILY